MEKEDGLPQYGCLCCIQKLESVVTFMKQCEESDKVLRKNLDTDHFKQGEKVNVRDLIQDIKSFSLDYSSDDQNQCSDVYNDDFAYDSTEDNTNKRVKNTRRKKISKKDAKTNENVTNKKVTEKNDSKIDNFLANNDDFAYDSMEDITNTKGRRKKVSKTVKKDANTNENVTNKKVTEKNDDKIDNFLNNDDFAYDSMEDITNTRGRRKNVSKTVKKDANTNENVTNKKVTEKNDDKIDNFLNNDDFAYDSMEDTTNTRGRRKNVSKKVKKDANTNENVTNKKVTGKNYDKIDNFLANNDDFAYDSMEDITNTRGRRKKVCKKDANTNENITNIKDTQKNDGKIDNFWVSSGDFAYDSMEDITNNDDCAYDSMEDITNNDDFAYDSMEDIKNNDDFVYDSMEDFTNKRVKNTRGRRKKVHDKVKKDANKNENNTTKKVTDKNDVKIDNFWASNGDFAYDSMEDITNNDDFAYDSIEDITNNGDFGYDSIKDITNKRVKNIRGRRKKVSKKVKKDANTNENITNKKITEKNDCQIDDFWAEFDIEPVSDKNTEIPSGELCHYCGKEFPPGQRNSYRDHIQNYHSEKKFKCDKCHRAFFTKLKLEGHHFNYHQKEGKRFACDMCDLKYESNKRLRCHKESIHLKSITYECDVCSKVFYNKHYFKDHQKRHTTEGELKCTLCNKVCCNKSALKNHLRSHTGERPYNCRYCDSKFTTRQTLKEHERLHTGEKPFKCPACQKGFSQNGNMKSHFKYNHRTLDFKKTREAFRLSLKTDKETDGVSNDVTVLEREYTNGES